MSKLHYPVLTEAFAPERSGENTAVDRVLEYLTRDDPWSYDASELRKLHLEAFNERLAQRREDIPQVAQRADQLGIDSVDSVDEILPLLFSPTMYKSYPESFIANGKWSHMLHWLDSFAASRIEKDVDITDVKDIDEFLQRVIDAGHRVTTTSGTSGKASLMPETELDAARRGEIATRTYGTMWGIDPSSRHPLFYTGHRRGFYNGMTILRAMEQAFGSPGTTYALFEEDLSVREVSQTAMLSRSMANGTASPSDLEALRANQEKAGARSARAVDRYVDLLVSHKDEPVYMWGQTYAFWLVMQRAKELGAPVAFHPDGSVIAAGGLKNNKLPEGYQDELRSFYNVRLTAGYGQAEVHGIYVECDEGRWHVPPNVLLILTDETGERAVPMTEGGMVQGIASSFDFSPVGRWGGLVSSDWVVADTSPCRCGLTSPSLVSCQRYDASAQGSDKLNCQGRIEMYIRGVLEDPK